MYPFAFDGGSRTLGYTFGSFDPRFDTRDGQLLLGWDTAATIPTNLPASRYILTKARVTMTVASERTFNYDPTHDVVWSYATNHPGYVPDSDLGRPVELVGAGFRNGYTAATYLESQVGTNSPYGAVGPITGTNISIETRNAFGAVFNEQGVLVDLSNNVGQTNASFTGPIFDFKPWALGQNPELTPGDLVPEGTPLHFDLDLGDPWINGYLQSAMASGHLRLVLTSLHPAAQAGFGGGGAYPLWYLRETLIGSPAKLLLEGSWIGPTDTDQDGLPDDWERHYFNSMAPSPLEDPDEDGCSNEHEWRAGTNPKNSASHFRIMGYRRSNGGAVFRFLLAPGRRYEVEESADLDQWSPAHGRFTYPENGVAEWIEEDPRVGPLEPVTRFHRVVTRE